jgi:CopG family transcriptional regulator/antitoxin EndoAI
MSLPPDLLKEAERLAKKEGRTKSELLREALRRYIEERKWQDLQSYGTRRARRLGAAAEDVERLVGEHRRGR